MSYGEEIFFSQMSAESNENETSRPLLTSSDGRRRQENKAQFSGNESNGREQWQAQAQQTKQLQGDGVGQAQLRKRQGPNLEQLPSSDVPARKRPAQFLPSSSPLKHQAHSLPLSSRPSPVHQGALQHLSLFPSQESPILLRRSPSEQRKLAPFIVRCGSSQGLFKPDEFLRGIGKPKSRIKCVAMGSHGNVTLITLKELLSMGTGHEDESDWEKQIFTLDGKQLKDRISILAGEKAQAIASAKPSSGSNVKSLPVGRSVVSSTVKAGTQAPPPAGTGKPNEKSVTRENVTLTTSTSSPLSINPALCDALSKKLSQSRKSQGSSSAASTDDESSSKGSPQPITVSSGSRPQVLSNENSQLMDDLQSSGDNKLTTTSAGTLQKEVTSSRASTPPSPVLSIQSSGVLAQERATTSTAQSPTAAEEDRVVNALDNFTQGIDNCLQRAVSELNSEAVRLKKLLTSWLDNEKERLMKREHEVEKREQKVLQREAKLREHAQKCRQEAVDQVKQWSFLSEDSPPP